MASGAGAGEAGADGAGAGGGFSVGSCEVVDVGADCGLSWLSLLTVASLELTWLSPK